MLYTGNIIVCYIHIIGIFSTFYNRPWDDVSTLTIQGKKQVCNPQELEICQVLGKGAYGIVHRMIHRPTKTVMAVKVCKCIDSIQTR